MNETINRGESVAQVQRNIQEGILRNLVTVINVGDLDVTGQTTALVHQCFVAPQKCYITGVKIVSKAALAANDTNYLTVKATNETQSEDLQATAPTTKATGGTAIAAKTAWSVGVDQNQDCAADDVITITVTPSTNSVANDITDVVIMIEYSVVDVDAE